MTNLIKIIGGITITIVLIYLFYHYVFNCRWDFITTFIKNESNANKICNKINMCPNKFINNKYEEETRIQAILALFSNKNLKKNDWETKLPCLRSTFDYFKNNNNNCQYDDEDFQNCILDRQKKIIEERKKI